MSNPIRKSMVWLGLADDQYEYDEPAEPVSPHLQPVVSRAASVTPLRQRSVVRPVVPETNEIVTVHPRQYKDAQQIAEHFRGGTPVIINLTQMTEAEARRLIDFASGLSIGLNGTIQRVTSKVFLLSPEHVTVSGEEQGGEAELDAAFTG